MICPKCGADNPESAEFCSLCTERLRGGGGTSHAPTSPGKAGHYVAPSEWRGDAAVLRPALSEAVERKVRRFRWKVFAYLTMIAALVIWLVLSLTLWSNPSPHKVCNRLLDAANRRDAEAFTQLFTPSDRGLAEDIYGDLILYLGTGGRFSGVSVRADRLDAYGARCYLEGGSIETGTGSTVEIEPGDNLVVSMENREGRWYVTARGTDIIP